MGMWVVSAALLLIWLVLAVFLHKSGFVHILLLSGVSLFVVQLLAHRKRKYQEKSAKQ